MQYERIYRSSISFLIMGIACMVTSVVRWGSSTEAAAFFMLMGVMFVLNGVMGGTLSRDLKTMARRLEDMEAVLAGKSEE